MDTFNIHEAKAHFSRIMRHIEPGEEVLIARDGTVIARIVPERRTLRFGIVVLNASNDLYLSLASAWEIAIGMFKGVSRYRNLQSVTSSRALPKMGLNCRRYAWNIFAVRLLCRSGIWIPLIESSFVNPDGADDSGEP